MNQFSKLFLVAVVTLGLCQLPSFAESRTHSRNRTMTGKTKTVTGCLTKGDEPNEYKITSTDGKMYGLRSTSVNLDEHLNHKVTVTGKMTKEHEEKGETAANKGTSEKGNTEKEAGDLSVSNLKMVSTSCQ